MSFNDLLLFYLYPHWMFTILLCLKRQFFCSNTFVLLNRKAYIFLFFLFATRAHTFMIENKSLILLILKKLYLIKTINHSFLELSFILIFKTKKNSTRKRFELSRAEPNWLAVNRLNHSATSSACITLTIF
jgi:hypothetical protein